MSATLGVQGRDEGRPTQPAAGLPRILQIDDNQGDLELGRLAVEECCGAGVEYHTLADGGEALRQLTAMGAGQARAPDLIILDVNIPRIDGWEILRHIRVDAGLAGVAVVVLSGSSSARDIERARSAGVDYHIKPPSYTELSRLLCAIIRQRLPGRPPL